MFTVASGSDEPSKTPRPAGGSIPTPKARRGPKTFLAETLREMKKVNWPTKSETNRLTGVVLAVCLLLTVVLSALGYLFGIVIDFLTKGTF